MAAGDTRFNTGEKLYMPGLVTTDSRSDVVTVVGVTTAKFVHAMLL